MRFKTPRKSNYIDYDRNPGTAYFEEGITNPKSALGGGNVIADPGSGVAIPVTASGRVEIVTGASGETNTLAVPTFAGQIIVLNHITDGGGDRVITVADPHIDGTNNTITLGDAGDLIVLTARKVAATPTYGWALLSNVGAALSHV